MYLNNQKLEQADFIVLDIRATPLMAFRNPDVIAKSVEQLSEKVFTLMMLGDDRAILATYIMGELAYEQSR